MKTERRHDLQTNWLADHIGRWLKEMQPYMSSIVAVAAAALLLVAAWGFFSRQAAGKAETAWAAYYAARSPLGGNADKLLEVAGDYAGTEVADWARLAAADERLRQGTALLLRDKKQGRINLQAAASDYKIARDSAKLEIVRNRAAFGLGRAHETLGQLNKAREAYAAVGGALAEVAAARAEKLATDDQLKEFYDWLATAEMPLPISPNAPGTPGMKPPFDGGSSPLGIPQSIDGKIDDAPDGSAAGTGAAGTGDDASSPLGLDRSGLDGSNLDKGLTGEAPAGSPLDGPAADTPLPALDGPAATEPGGGANSGDAPGGTPAEPASE